MEVRGSITDRPWGLTLGAIGLRRHTGQLTIDADGKRYSIAFQDGAVVAATSPQPADAIARIALTNHFITSTQVTDITRRLATLSDRDEVEVLAEAIRFTPEQVLKLRHRLVAQRAARTFSLEHGEFVLDDRIALPVHPGVAVDHRHVIYFGVRTNLAEQRLVDDLRQLGAYFVLKPGVADELPRFGFEPAAHPVLEALKLGTSLPELEASHRELDPRFAQAIIYALVSCTACVIPPRNGSPAAPPTAPPRSIPTRDATPRLTRRSVHPAPPEREARSTTPQPAPVERPAAGTLPPGSGARRPTLPPSGSRTTSAPLPARTASGSSTAYANAAAHDAGTNTPAALRARTSSDTPPPDLAAPAARPVSPAPAAIQTAPAARSAGRASSSPAPARTETDEGVRFPEMPTPSPLPGSAKRPGAAVFGEPQPTRAASASSPPTRPALARVPTPNDSELRGFGDQRTPSGFVDQRTPGFGDQRTPSSQRTPTDPSRPRTPTGSPLPSRVSTDNAASAEEAFRRGELAMKRDQPGEAVLEFKTACDLNPNDVDYAAMLAWAKFCAAGDKAAIGADTRKALERAVYKSNKPERARFYLGRVERMLGRDKEALRHFQEVLDLKPNHADAASEIRAIESRLHSSGKTGLFGRKR
ncbi:MAG TPA: DUF4388 domain-containing protein [Kofleriaceae bacterium]|jgi:hypothetical protein|nr:DUF4388 domain-containing protein [Kofleriaceae bacterium]